ncbi:MAG TPA: hypothetical protein VGP68_09375 [Gemmataceae bacterium]|jgi:uncharacterized protein (TIGR03000 family)|nr:hypothetical protein [Gemmataceae bacterium]
MRSRVILAALISMLALGSFANPAQAQRGGWGGGPGRGWGYGGYGYGRFGYGGYGYGRYGYGWGGYGWGGVGIGIDLGWPYYNGYPYYYGAYPYASTPLLYSNPAVQYPIAPPAVIGAQQPAVPGTPATPPPQGAAVASNGPAQAITQAFYKEPPAVAGRAELIVKVPLADAQVGIGALQSEQLGVERHFYFPALNGDRTFMIRGQWRENGHLVTREKQVNMRAGQKTTLDLGEPSEGKPATPQSTAPPAKPLADSASGPRL